MSSTNHQVRLAERPSGAARGQANHLSPLVAWAPLELFAGENVGKLILAVEEA
jgi:hypothetical protein